MKKSATWISNHSLLIVIISIFLLIPAIFGAIHTKINYDILSYLPKDIETIKGQNILTEEFGIGGFSFVLTNEKNNASLAKLENKIKKIEGVNQVLSINSLTDLTIPMDILPETILEKIYQKDETIILVTFKHAISDEITINGIEELRNTVENASKVSGMTSLILDTMNISKEEMNVYIILAGILCLIVLLFATDSYLIPIFLLGNIGIAIIFNLGSNIFLGQISYITQAITAVLQLGVTMDFSIFLYHKYEHAKKIKSQKKEAMSIAITETFKSILGSSLTTIAGFLALCAMSLTLGKDIGIVMAKGVICGLLCVLTLFPSLLLVFDQYVEKTKHKVLLPNFKKLQQFAINHYKLIFIIFLILLIPAIIGNNNVNIYYKLDEALPEDLPSRVANSELAQKFNIISPEIILIDKNIDTNQKNQLITQLENIEGISLVLSKIKLEQMGISELMIPEELLNVMQNDNYEIIILNSVYEIASSKLNNQIKEISDLIKQYDTDAIVAGEGALTKDLVEIADHDLLMVNYISIGIIFILMIIVLKSISLPIILVIVIEFAIFSNIAIAYFTNTSIPFIASIVIGTIQLGATIDYAILLSSTYLEERIQKDKKLALTKTLEKTIPSIIVSALCFFAATFGVAMYSKIDMIGSICNLLSRGAIISMLVVSLLLPSFLLITDKIIMKTTFGKKGNEL